MDTKEKLVLNSTNLEQILKSVKYSEKFIICWGKIGENNSKVRAVQREILDHLQAYEDKLHVISSPVGGTGFHPIAPQIRFEWIIERFVCPEYLQVKPEAKSGEKVADEPSKTAPSESPIDPTKPPKSKADKTQKSTSV